jgi:hypothetical protein
MVLAQIEMHSNEKDINEIIAIIKSQILEYGYKIRSSKDEYLEHYSIRISKDLYRWIINFDIRLDRTGNLVKAEISRLEPFVIDKKIMEFFQRERENQSRNTRSQSFWSILWRSWWIYLIASFVGSIILSVFPWVNRSITNVGYTLMGLLGSVIILFVVGIFYNRHQRSNEIEKVQIVKSHLVEIIEGIDDLKPKEKIICWSCFEEILPEKRQCPKCGVNLVKV